MNIRKCILPLVLFLLAVFPASAELELPPSLQVIEAQAFYGDPSVTSVVLPEGIRSIGPEAFAHSGLTEITLPDTLTQIADDAFTGCKRLKVHAPENSYAYSWAVRQGYIQKAEAPASDFEYEEKWYRDGITITGYTGSGGYVIVPEQISGLEVTAIGYKAFTGTDVTGVMLPETVRIVEQEAFHDCTSLGSIMLPSHLDELNNWAFAGCTNLVSVRIPDGVTRIENCLFYGCSQLKQVALPDGITEVGDWVFAGCGSLTGTELPDTVTSLGERSFAWCSSITEMRLPAGIVSIGNNAFDGCSGMERISLPQGLASIGESAFTYCSKLSSIVIPQGISAIPAHAFDNCSALTTVSFPEGLASIGESAFANCRKLPFIAIPQGISAIPAHAFEGCTALKAITLPEGLASIGDYAFSGCTGVLSFSIPVSVTRIGAGAFSSLSSTLIFRESIPAISSDAFSGSSLIMNIPSENAGWDTQADYGAKVIIWQWPGDGQTIPDDTKDPTETLKSTSTNNQNGNNYQDWSTTVKSYLVTNGDGSYTRVEYTGSKVLIEEYSGQNKLVWKKTLTPELPIWGGFFSGDDYNFLVYGQNNEEENDGKEVVRIVKYTKNWNRVAHCSVYGANTIHPFAFGSVRFSQSGDILYVYTCHEMYTTPDGKNHQANMSFEVYIPTMRFTHQNYTIGGEAYEYVSHSLNQLLVVDGSDIVKVDHGDAYPRSIKLMKIQDSAGYLAIGVRTEANMLAIAGETGANFTGVSIGALQASGTRYIVAGNSIDMEHSTTSNQRNIFVSTVPKNAVSDENVHLTWITSHAENSGVSVSTPQMVKISNSRFLLLWSEGSKVKYVFLNGSGKKLTGIYSATGSLSDCQPVIDGDNAVWYVTRDSGMKLYSISLTSPYALTTR